MDPCGSSYLVQEALGGKASLCHDRKILRALAEIGYESAL